MAKTVKVKGTSKRKAHTRTSKKTAKVKNIMDKNKRGSDMSFNTDSMNKKIYGKDYKKKVNKRNKK